MFCYSFIVCLLLVFFFLLFGFLLFTFGSVSLHLCLAARRKNNLASLWSFRFHIAWVLLSLSFVSFLLFIFRFQFSFHEFFAFLSLSSWIFRLFWFLFFWQGAGRQGPRGGRGALSNPWAALREIASVVQTLGALFNLPLRQCAPFIQSTFRSSPSSLRVCLRMYVCACLCVCA